ncbi:S8 family serine peptidase [Streptosporangium sp. NPDC051023]|uniref:S8 family serine peptidase n=1 Tax=Streptosporangium sp. NPDC051023 TaxID=3155410 RepID=UPI00344F5645
MTAIPTLAACSESKRLPHGRGSARIFLPLSYADAFTVGGVDEKRRVPLFSSRGPVGGLSKPDITAPGVDVLSAMSPISRSSRAVFCSYCSLCVGSPSGQNPSTSAPEGQDSRSYGQGQSRELAGQNVNSVRSRNGV